MAEILKEWLTERLSRPIKWEPQEFGDMMKNGAIVASVLLSYHVINDDQHFLIRDSNMPMDIQTNWNYLTEWLHELNIYLSDTDLVNIKDGKGSVLLRLFYQLFLTLDNKDRTDFIKRERKMVSSLVEKMGNRFQVDKVAEVEKPEVDYLSKPLLDERRFIEWQKKKSQEVKDVYDFIKHRYKKILERMEESKTESRNKIQVEKKITSKEKKDMEKFALTHPCKYENYTYEELLELETRASEHQQSIADTDWAKTYMNNLHTRMHKRTDSEEFQKQIRNTVSNTLWDLSVGEEESLVDIDLGKKVMKLSQFEKQMCTQIMETKQQARNLVKNRIAAEKEFNEQRDHQFCQYLDNVKEQIYLEGVEIDFEKHRQEMLHQKLYAEKMRRKRLHYYEICYETVLALIDYATKYAYFLRLMGGDVIPSHYIHEWKTLFFRMQPIFDLLEPMEDLLKENALEEEEVEPEYEEIKRLEQERQNHLNDNDFIEYHNYSYPWTLDTLIPNYDPESEERKYEYLGTRILGHVVYTLLQIKYPAPPPRPPADLPPFTSKALVIGVPDKAMTLAMQTLLTFNKIYVVRLESAINFCLRKYKSEMVGIVTVDVNYDKFIHAVQEEEGKEFLRTLKSDEEAHSKSTESISAIIGTLPATHKITQTPKVLPEEELKLSAAADLGKYAYDALSFGDSLTDHLLAAMLVEYIKDLKDINGFVIINYPNSYREAAILEETFSGREPPPEEDISDRDDIYLEETIAKHRRKEKDPFKEIRVSRLVSDPHKNIKEEPFESYFTCYIKLKETADILQEFVIWDLTEENSELIDRFYAILGLNYSMYYEVIEKPLLAQICKYIIGDLSTPLKSCDTLFGSNVYSMLDFTVGEDRRTKSKIVRPEVSFIKSKDKLKRRSKSKLKVKDGESSEEWRGENITIVEEHVTEEEPEIKSEAATAEEVNVLAGEEDWDYGELPISENIGIALADCWEAVEKTYINDLEQLFFSIRLQMNCLIPYSRFIKDKMNQIITLPSAKQNIVSNFQNQYNNFEDDWRDVNLVKNEWHCRIHELRDRLYNICDERKMFAEQRRQELIMDNWAVNELTTMANTYISCMQAELNRSVLTFQALHDFYFTMLKKLPPNDRLISKDLTLISRESDDTSSKKSTEDKVFRSLKNTYQEFLLKDVEIDFSNNPFNMIIENNVKFAQKVVKDINEHYRSLVAKEYNDIAKMVVVVKKKDGDVGSIDSVNEEEIFKMNALKCVDEWIMGINGEMFRASLRMLALQYKCYHDMKLFNDHIFKSFLYIQGEINNYYANEIQAVDRLCKYFQMAVENGRKIPETLILEHDTFVIDPNLLQFVPPEPEPCTGEITEPSNDLEFQIGQLARLRTQFKIVAPTGLALQQAFIYLLQDFVFFGKESCDGPLVPESWKRVDPEKIPKLVFLLFGETAYVDWRDFLIHCIGIRFPTVDELLELRYCLRCLDPYSTELISRDDFLKQTLWFEADFDPDDPYAQLRKAMIKHFIFELYETSEDEMNYSAFLLAFCKHNDPVQGFAAALSMATGKKICSRLEDCEEFICKMIKIKQYKDESLACALKCAQELIDKLITIVVDICEGTTVIDMGNVQSMKNLESKRDISKKGGKGKKIDTTRNPKPGSKAGKSAGSMTGFRSTTEVNHPYICKPCEEPEPTEDKEASELKESIEEEHKSEVLEDPNLDYAVPQNVIWNVLKICLPWHFELFPEEKMTPYVGMVEEVMKRLEVNHETGQIYVALFTADPNICKFLHKTKKFKALSLIDQVRQVSL